MSGYEKAFFGDGSDTGSGNVTTAVSNQYGPRDDGGTVGNIKTEGSKNELSFDLTGEAINRKNGSAADAFLVAPILPKGAKVTSVYLEVTEAFSATGTTPAVEIGTDGSEATNGFTTSEAQLEAVGVYDLTSALSGTWAAILAADTTVGVALSGTTPVFTDVGKGRYVIAYDTTAK